MKVVILLVQQTSKVAYLDPREINPAPEATSGVFGRSLFLWLNSLIFAGYKKVLTVDDLQSIDERLCSTALWASFGKVWDACKLPFIPLVPDG